MNDELFALVATWGVPLMAAVTFLSCLALPVPASLAMLAAGGFSAAGEFSLASVGAAALAGAVLGDLTGYLLARAARPWLLSRLDTRPRRRVLFERAERLIRRNGGPGIFLSRWLVSPLGPYANFAAGIIGMRSARFLAWGIAGEIVWVTLYVGLGRVFADRLDAVAQIASQASGLVAALTVVGITAFWITRSRRRRRLSGA